MVKSIYSSFNLANQNPDQGGGLLYALRYSKDMLDEKRKSLIKVLSSDMGVGFRKLGKNRIGIIDLNPRKSKDKMHIIMALLEELSVINEAQEYMDAGFEGLKSLEAFFSSVKSLYYTSVINGNTSVSYEYVTVFIPRIISDLRLAHTQNGVLSRKELEQLEELEKFSISELNKLSNINPKHGVTKNRVLH